MPRGTEDAKTLSTENILDLRGLVTPDMTVIDSNGREWPIVADLPLRTALALLKHAEAWQRGELTERVFDDTVDAMWSILRRGTREATREEVIEAFTLTEMLKLIDFFYARMQARNQEAREPTGNGAAPAHAEPSPAPHPTPEVTTAVAATRRPRRSPRRSSAASS